MLALWAVMFETAVSIQETRKMQSRKPWFIERPLLLYPRTSQHRPHKWLAHCQTYSDSDKCSHDDAWLISCVEFQNYLSILRETNIFFRGRKGQSKTLRHAIRDNLLWYMYMSVYVVAQVPILARNWCPCLPIFFFSLFCPWGVFWWVLQVSPA